MYKNLKTIFYLFFLLLLTQPAIAAEEIQLPESESGLHLVHPTLKSVVDYYTSESSTSEHTYPKILDAFTKKGYVSEYDSPIDSVKFGVVYTDEMQLDMPEGGDLASKYSYKVVEPYMMMNFNENQDTLTIRYNLVRDIPGYENYFTEKITQLSVRHKINEHQKIVVGQDIRVPIGVDGYLPTVYLDTVLRAQIARTFSNTCSVGVRNMASYKYMDYDIGVYDSTRFMQNFFGGSEFAGWVNFKPLADVSDKYGNLKIGTGVDWGHNKYDYSVWGAYLGYDYKKFHTKFEYANADGYNSIKPVNNKAEGFYLTAMYDILPKTQLVGRYDYFNKNKSLSNASTQEYTIGITYYLKENLRLLLNYVWQDNENAPDSNMVMFSTRFLI